MKILGLTGNTGSGKSTVSNILDLHGGYIIDADEISHEVIRKGKTAYAEVIDLFGKDILGEDEEINRRKLGSMVFSNAKKLASLSRIVHRDVILSSLDIISKVNKENKNSFIVIDAPLLIEARMHHICDEVWIVYADADVRTERIMKRDGLDKEEAEQRVKAQTDFETLKKFATRVLYNNGDVEALQLQMKCALINFIKEPRRREHWEAL